MEPGETFLCTVEKISGTTVFVKIEDNGEGTIVTSEIAPGRIRNLRDYVVPGKKIVCKILKIYPDNIHLSLRRVSGKERKEVLDRYDKEKSSLSILRSIIKEKAEEVTNNIKKERKSLYEFLQFCKTNPQELEKHLSKEDAIKVCQILAEKKEKEKEIKKEFLLSSSLPDGMAKIKRILLPCKENITYVAAGKYLVKIKAEDYKKANIKLQEILSGIEKKAREEKLEFNVKEK